MASTSIAAAKRFGIIDTARHNDNSRARKKAGITLDAALAQCDPARDARVWRDMRPAAPLRVNDNRLTVTVAAKSIVAFAIPPRVKPRLQAKLYATDSAPLPAESFAEAAAPFGKVHATLLRAGRGLTSSFVYTEALPENVIAARLRWRQGSGAWQALTNEIYPYEFSPELRDDAGDFECVFEVESATQAIETSPLITLRLGDRSVAPPRLDASIFPPALSYTATMHATLDDWIRHEAIPFPVDSSDAATDKVIASLDDSVELLGFGEALHGGEDILMLRNRLFRRLVEAHGYSAIAIESSFPKARVVNDYVAGNGPASYEAVQDTGFSHGFGRLDANRELVEWMRRYNADASHRVPLRFDGFDIPTLTAGIASPSQVLHFVLDYLTSIDRATGPERRQRIDSLLGPDSDWESPAAMADPTQSVGLSPAATALRIETEDLIAELRIRRPELVTKGDEGRYLEALQYASMARELLNFHAASARKSDELYARLLGIRDALMADNLAFIVGRERGRGKVLAFAHNSHLQRGKAVLPWYRFWPAGSHLNEMFGPRYVVIGSGVGVSDANGIGQPEAGTIEARLTALPGPARLIPTYKGEGLPGSEIAALPTRSGSNKNSSYTAMTSQSISDFDWLVVLDSTTYARGGRPLAESDKCR